MKYAFEIVAYIVFIIVYTACTSLNDHGFIDNSSSILFLAENRSLLTFNGTTVGTGNLNKGVNLEDRLLEPSVDIIVANDDRIENYVSNIKEPEISEILQNDMAPHISLPESLPAKFENVEIPLTIVNRNEDKQVGNKNFHNESIIENVSLFNTNIKDKENIVIRPISNEKKEITENKKEDIPSFSEWTQKRLEEVEKNEQVNLSSKTSVTNAKASNTKVRWKNYASLDCGAKVIAANPESVSPGAILSPSGDEYKLNPCASRIWFVVELCETIQIKKIDIANYELFSSSPKDFTVSISDRYPSRDWSVVGKFTALDERNIQSFDLNTNIFGKFIKVDINSHYGSEHYCPISLFRAYGTSVFEVLQKEEDIREQEHNDDDGDFNDDDANGDIPINDKINTIVERDGENPHKNLFSSATDAVILMVKRAAEVLSNKVNNDTSRGTTNKTVKHFSLNTTCTTPRHIIYCKNCSDSLFGQIYELISCRAIYIKKLIRISEIYKGLSNSVLCQNFDYEYKISANACSTIFTHYVISFFPPEYIGAICNEIAVWENRGVLNNNQYLLNTTIHNLTEKLLSPKDKNYSEDTNITKIIEKGNNIKIQISGAAVLEINSTSEIVNLGDTIHMDQINPTKPLSEDDDFTYAGSDLNTTSSSIIISTVEGVKTETLETVSYGSFIEQAIGNSEMEVISEGIDVIDDHFDNFVSELQNSDCNQNLSPSLITTKSPQGQKESIFLRLSNRIKALESNVSMSSQYLEELSRRYKKQIEEIQNLLEKTVEFLKEDDLKKDLKYKELENRLNNVTAILESLMYKQHICWLIASVVIISSICYFFGRLLVLKYKKSMKQEANKNVCYGSINPILHNRPEEKKRRPSDQALRILHDSCTLNSDKEASYQRPKRKNKHAMKRSNSISHIKDTNSQHKSEINSAPDWIESSHRNIEESIPYILDESDHCTIDTYNIVNEAVEIKVSNNSIPFNYEANNRLSQYSNKVLPENLGSDCYIPTNNSNSKMESSKKEKRGLKRLLKRVF